MGDKVYFDERSLIKTVMKDIDIFLIETPTEKERNCYEPKEKRKKKADVFYNMQAVVLSTAPKFW